MEGLAWNQEGERPFGSPARNQAAHERSRDQRHYSNLPGSHYCHPPAALSSAVDAQGNGDGYGPCRATAGSSRAAETQSTCSSQGGQVATRASSSDGAARSPKNGCSKIFCCSQDGAAQGKASSG